MTRQLLQGRLGVLDVLLRSDDPARLHPPRPGLAATDLICELKRPGATSWVPAELQLQDAGHGAYVVSLAARDLDFAGPLFVRLDGRPGLDPPVLPAVVELEVVVPRDFRAPRPTPDRTLVVGQLVGLDGRPRPRATIAATLLQPPILVEGAAVAGDSVLGVSDDEGAFELPLLTGATVDVQIAAVRYRRTLVVPPAPAPGVPVRLFSIP